MPSSKHWFRLAKGLSFEEKQTAGVERKKWWERRDGDTPREAKRDHGPKSMKRDSNIDPERTLFIADLPRWMDESRIRKHYHKMGKQAIQFIRWDKSLKGKPTGCIWIVFRTPELCRWALKFEKPEGDNGQELQVLAYGDAPSRKRVSALLEESKSKRQKLDQDVSKNTLKDGKVLMEVKWTAREMEKRPFKKDFSHLITYQEKPQDLDEYDVMRQGGATEKFPGKTQADTGAAEEEKDADAVSEEGDDSSSDGMFEVDEDTDDEGSGAEDAGGNTKDTRGPQRKAGPIGTQYEDEQGYSGDEDSDDEDEEEQGGSEKEEEGGNVKQKKEVRRVGASETQQDDSDEDEEDEEEDEDEEEEEEEEEGEAEGEGKDSNTSHQGRGQHKQAQQRSRPAEKAKVGMKVEDEGDEDEEDEDEEEEDDEDEDEDASSGISDMDMGGDDVSFKIEKVLTAEDLKKEEEQKKLSKEEKEKRIAERKEQQRLREEKRLKHRNALKDAMKAEDAKKRQAPKAATDVKVEGDGVPDPLWSFDEVKWPKEIASVLGTRFTRPTPIQCYAWPAIMKGLDVIGLADTGSGKTMAYLVPGIIHLKAQKPPMPGDGPVMLILAPTRELVLQIATEAERFKEAAKVRVALAYGGLDGMACRVVQGEVLAAGVDIVAATPGRLIDFIEAQVCRLFRVSYLVLDEADHMLDLGFAPQIRNIGTQVRPDRQMLMWSATWQRDVKILAKEFVNRPVKIIINKADELKANTKIEQEVIVVKSQEQKHTELKGLLKRVRKANPGASRTMIFVNRKVTADKILKDLKGIGYRVLAIHGDLNQKKRENAVMDLRIDPEAVMVATDVAARGLDIRALACVVNFDLPRLLDQYVHRIGRTGRAGSTGLAVSFFFPRDDQKIAKKLIKCMKEAGQKPSYELCKIVNQSKKELDKEKKEEEKKGKKGQNKFGLKMQRSQGSKGKQK